MKFSRKHLFIYFSERVSTAARASIAGLSNESWDFFPSKLVICIISLIAQGKYFDNPDWKEFVFVACGTILLNLKESGYFPQISDFH